MGVKISKHYYSYTCFFGVKTFCLTKVTSSWNFEIYICFKRLKFSIVANGKLENDKHLENG